MNRLQDVGEDRSHHEINLVAFEQALHLDHGGVGFEFVVYRDDLDIATSHLAADILDREYKTVARLLAEHCGRTR